MIRINLAPVDEIENKLWFLADVAVAAAVAVVVFLGTQSYEIYLGDELSRLQRETAEHIENSKRLEPTLNKYKELTSQKVELEEKIASLERITVSKIDRYKPVILLEHLQNIKPDGLWFVELKENSKDETITLEGSAFDSLLIAEFMSALDSTRFQDADPSDMRSQIFFKSVNLDIVSSKDSGSKKGSGSGSVDSDQSATATNATSSNSTTNNNNDAPVDNLEEFVSENPEFARFPMFRLNLKYASRGQNPAPKTFEQSKNAGKAGAL